VDTFLISSYMFQELGPVTVSNAQSISEIVDPFRHFGKALTCTGQRNTKCL
jgi:hypothetical protein